MTPFEAAAIVAESLSDAVFFVDRDGTLTGSNKIASELLGSPRASLIGKPITAIVEADATEVTRKLGLWRRSRSPVPGTLTFRTPSGPLKLLCEAALLPLGEADSGHLLIIQCRARAEGIQRFTALEEKIQALALEVHARQRIEKELRDSERRFRGIFDHASDAILIADDNGLIVEANPAACELVGRPIDELSNLHATDLAPGAFRDEASTLWKTFIESGTQRGYMAIQRPDGEIRETEYSAVRNFIEGRHLSILRDVTDAQFAAAERERQARALAKSNAELEQFAYVASHDLQEPLRTISSFLELTRRRLESLLDAETEDLMSMVQDGVHRLQRIILDLLEFSRLGRAERQHEIVNLQEIVGQSLLSLDSAMKDSDAQVSVGPLPRLEGDPTQLYQLFLNLIGNALKFRSGRPEIQVRAEHRGDEWAILVSDNGQGIEPEYFERIFEPFRRLHGRDVPGSGIGLALAKRVVENHGGRIWVESQPGVGSTFIVALPARAPREHG